MSNCLLTFSFYSFNSSTLYCFTIFAMISLLPSLVIRTQQQLKPHMYVLMCMQTSLKCIYFWQQHEFHSVFSLLIYPFTFGFVSICSAAVSFVFVFVGIKSFMTCASVRYLVDLYYFFLNKIYVQAFNLFIFTFLCICTGNSL